MKGDRTLVDIPFRYGGIMHNYDMDVEDWQGVINKRCWCCGGDMTRNMYLKSGVLLQKLYPYVAVFKITKGKHRGQNWFKTLCRGCAYDYGRGVIEMDGNTYMNPVEFNESKYKKEMRIQSEDVVT